uniref:Pre-rRNA-processing protein TSR2 homolog n=1 Tax=Ixodes ricinus TaxID=34613 RepID=A0A131XPS4_IXORI
MATESAFHVSIKTLIGDWQGFQIAIENGMGGPDAKAKEKWLVQAIEEYFAQNANLHPDEVEYVLASILDTEFDTIIEDGSVAQISAVLCKHYQLCQEGRENEVLQSLTQRLPRTPTVAFPMQTDYSSGDEAEMQEHVNTQVSSQLGNLRLNGQNEPPAKPEPDEDGWTTVRHGRRT